MRHSRGFSLVELMIVIAIIGILAAIAIPNFIAMQLKSKRSEVPGNVDGIKTAQLAYDAAFDGFISANVAPRDEGALDKNAIAWAADNDWTAMNWAPDGLVRGHYEVQLTGGDGGSVDFYAIGRSDVDNDESSAVYAAQWSINATMQSDVNYY